MDEDDEATSLQWRGAVRHLPGTNAARSELPVQVTFALEGKMLQALVDLRLVEGTGWPATARAHQHWFSEHLFADDARDKLAVRH